MNITHNLSIRSDHSIGESTLQIGTIVDFAISLGYTSLGMVDTMSISSLVDFTNKCKKAEIKPIIGCTIRIYDDPAYRKPSKVSGEKERKNPFYQLKVYIKSDKGLRSLMKLLTKGNSEEYFYYHSRVGLKEILDLEDVIITTGDIFNVYHTKNHSAIINSLVTSFGKENVFVELTPINTPLFDTLNQAAIESATHFQLPIIAGYPCFYKSAEDAGSLDVLRAITSNSTMDSRSLSIPFTRDMCMSEPTNLAARLVELSKRITGLSMMQVKEALLAGGKIAETCTFEFKKLEPSLPKMTADDFMEMVTQCKLGWANRFSQDIMGFKPSDLNSYKERLAYELSVIKSLGFATYFLVVQDIVQWTKANGIIVGPGRGSAGGSLISYLMGITDVDPIRFDLLFERFINPDRTDLPDIDLDFMSSRRHEVIKYIINKYGQENVAGISNYSTLGTASSIRDVSRVHGLDIFEYQCSKQVEKEHGVSVSLELSAEAVPDIAKFKLKYPTVWKHATTLEGCMRNLGQHAAGVIVAGEPIINRAVLKKPDEDGLPVVFWDKQVVEDWGLIKMDILGLSTLDSLKLATTFIQERKGITVDLLQIPLDEPDVMEAFGKGETIGVFQFEGNGMQKLLKQLATLSPLTFEDISAATALYRPGPIDAGLVDQFVAVKQGMRSPEYDHPSMIPALQNTYGVLTYQEQIQRVCIDLAGMTATEADYVRRAMGKKDMKKMQEQAPAFIKGAVISGMTEYAASILWDKIAGFAGYCFNKSHSVEYSVISYWCVSGKTKIYDWKNKKYITVAGAFRDGVDEIACYDEVLGKTVGGKVKKVIRTTGAKNIDLKMGYVMRTKSNKHLECSAEHLILTPNGYKKLIDLKPGDMVASEKRVSVMTAEKRQKIADSTVKHWETLEINERTSKVSAMHKRPKELKAAAAKLGWSKIDDEVRKDRVQNLIDSSVGGKWGSRKTGNIEACGHRHSSSNEKFVCDWLNAHEIEHESQVWLGNGFADWLIQGVYIEYDGVGRKESYFEEKYGEKPYIVITSKDDVDEALSFALGEELLRAGGFVTFEPIVSITQTKPQVMYDIVMEENPHNFLANGVVVHNCMWLKVRYPAEFFAATMTVIDKDEKLTALVDDAKKRGIKILPPDINISSNKIEIQGDNELYAPFQAIKGISDNVAKYILEVRELRRVGVYNADGTTKYGSELRFNSKAEFEIFVAEAGLNSKINKSHREKLDLVGAFASIEPETLPALSDKRLKDRLELMPGFTTETVKATRGISTERLIKIKVVSLLQTLESCDKCSLKGQPHPSPRLGKTPKFMMVFDSPDYKEGNAGKMLESDTGAYVKSALSDAGLSVNDGYFTSLVKAPKTKGSKGLTNEMINGCSDYLKQEIELLKPPVIIAMGSNAVKYFVPSIKGAPADYSGKVIFNQALDANIVLGINPSSLHFDGSKVVLLQNLCAKIATIISD